MNPIHSIARPAATVGMPVFNGARYIRAAIESVLCQTLTDFELLISDNASTDETANICREYAIRDKRIRLVVQERNLGAFRNFRFVTDHANGALLTWLAHDDALDARFLEETVAYLKRNVQSVLVCADLEIINDSGSRIEVEELKSIRAGTDWQDRCAEFYKYPISNAYFAIYGTMWTEKCRAILAGIKEPKKMAQIELPFLARFAAVGQIASLPIVLRSYRRHDDSLFYTEHARLQKNAGINAKLSKLVHALKLIFDQIQVLALSCLRDRGKFAVLAAVAKYYAARIWSKSAGVIARSR
jgi:glycosyltransferase involved in cell wall biosynthesis